PLILVFSFTALIILSGIVSWGMMNLKVANQTVQRERAVQIAESGIEYYRWHLAHAPVDYQDGTGLSGPYMHDFYNRNGDKIGEFSLTITPPPIGSSLVTVTSAGKSGNDFHGERTISARLAKPSLVKYAVVANDAIRFGEGTEVQGPLHSNNGIRFDGLAHNLVTSAVAKYDDPDHLGDEEFGVHTHLSPTDPLPPASVPARSDVFVAGRQFPVPAADFAGLTADISQMKTDSQADGFYRSGSGVLGYHVVLKTSDTFDLYQINSLRISPDSKCSYDSQVGWGTWSINTEALLGNYPFPNNGLIYLEDDVFVNGQINSARLTIVAAIFPDNPSLRKNITINNNLLYTNYDGQDVISLIAQNNINVGLYSLDTLRIDAALVAQNGRAGRYYYNGYCGTNSIRQTITLYGMIASAKRYGFAYTNGTGYQVRNIIYDNNLLYSPPPSFPLTSDQYITLSWGEIK
ncbi:MAG: hypothetical protein WC415_06050, partial [Patescibacteria group bacterium]